MTTIDHVQPASGEANRLMITLIAMAAAIMQVLDTTIANVALPHMQGSLGATQDQVAWVLTSYIVATAIATPLTGWFASRLGRTRVFVLAVAAFTVASIACGAAQTLSQMVLFRILQGVAGAIVVPLVQAIMLDAYPRSETARAMSIFATGVMIGPIMGPIIGGYLTGEYNWRWCFYINVPLGIVAILGAIAFIPETARTLSRKFDWLGFLFFSLAIASFMLILDRGEQKGWFQSPEILVEAALTVFGLYMFIVHSATTTNPFIDIRLFRDRTYITAVSIMGLIFTIYLGAQVLVPQMLQLEMNYPVMTAGIATAPRGVGMTIAVIVIGRIGNRIDPRAIIALGMVVTALSLYMMSLWSMTISTSDIVWTGLLQGVGMGAISVPASIAAFSTLSIELRNDGSAFFSLMRNFGGAVGVAIVASRIVEVTQVQHGHLVEFMTPFRHMPATSGMHAEAALKMLNLGITQQAGMIAYINGYLLMAIVAVAMLPLIFLIRVSRSAAPWNRDRRRSSIEAILNFALDHLNLLA